MRTLAVVVWGVKMCSKGNLGIDWERTEQKKRQRQRQGAIGERGEAISIFKENWVIEYTF